MKLTKLKEPASWIIGFVFALLGTLFAFLGCIIGIAISRGWMHTSASSTGDIIILPLIFCGFGILFLAIGIPFLVIRANRIRKKAQVLADGRYITAMAVGVSRNFNVTINGMHPYRLECQYRDGATGITHVFRSDDLYYDPSELVGTPIRVYADPRDLSCYYVAVDEAMGPVELH